MSYEHKYLKYKKKYIEKKNEILFGGVNDGWTELVDLSAYAGIVSFLKKYGIDGLAQNPVQESITSLGSLIRNNKEVYYKFFFYSLNTNDNNKLTATSFVNNDTKKKDMINDFLLLLIQHKIKLITNYEGIIDKHVGDISKNAIIYEDNNKLMIKISNRSEIIKKVSVGCINTNYKQTKCTKFVLIIKSPHDTIYLEIAPSEGNITYSAITSSPSIEKIFTSLIQALYFAFEKYNNW
jgi:hypothetical protein